MKGSVLKKKEVAYECRLLKKRVLPILFAALLSAFGFKAHAQDIKVTGHVVNEQGQPVPQASVVLKGTTKGVSTNDNGNFTITAPKQGSLVVSFVGYTTLEIPIRNRTTLTVSLSIETGKANDVVVIGYGTQRREAITGSVASISGSNLNEVPSANISQALQGRIAGVNIAQTDSRPGATTQIRIRGTRSLTAGNDPLIILDGIPFPGTIADIDPTEVKSLDILKDASATAIYGSRGANGVILITTNKGQQGAKPRITYTGYYGIKDAIKYPMMNAAEFIALKKAAKQFTSYGTDEDSTGKTDIDWQNLLYQTGHTTSQAISISSGTDKGSYNFGGSYYRDEAVIPLQNYTRYSLHGSVDQGIGNHIRVGFTTNNNFGITNGNSLNAYTALSTTPIANPYNADGSLKRIVNMALDQNWVYTKQSLNALGNKFIDQSRNLSTYNSVYAEVKIPGVEGLKYRANLGLNYTESNYGGYTGYGVFSSSTSTLSSATISDAHNTNWAIENLLTYDKTIGKNKINVTALNSSEQTTYWYSTANATGIQNDAFQFYNLGAVTDPNGQITINPANQVYYQRGLSSYMGRIMYSYDDRYLLSGTIRSDASSVLAPGHKWHTYTALSGGWNVMKESFMKNITLLDNLKLRAGYGQTSNQSINPYQTLGLLSSTGYDFGPNNYVTGYNVTQLPNPGLGWEYTKTWNYGVDFSMLKRRLSGTIEYYVQKTSDLLLSVSLPATAGVGSVLQNIGSTQNKGFELSLNGTIVQTKDWTWDLGVNVYTNRNKVTALASGSTQDINNSWFVGYPIDNVYDYKKIGLWQTTDPDYKYLQNYEPGGTAGMIKVQYTGTYNADGSPTRPIGTADRQVYDLQPKFEGGFNTRVAYKNIDLAVVGFFKDGGTLISTLYGNNGYLNMESGRRENVKIDYWTPTNTGAKYPNPAGPVNSNNPKYGSTLGYFSASYLKVSTISLGYSFNQAWVKRAGIAGLRLYVTTQNPFVFFSPYHKESGMDPQPNSYGNQNQAVTSYPTRLLVVGTNTPTTHNFLVGANLTF